MVFAHKGEKHSEGEFKFEEAKEEKIIRINKEYESNIKAIFQNKCFDCHGQLQSKPFYYDWPIAKKIIRDDIKKSKEHLDMSNGIPFGGHGTFEEDLNAIEESVISNSMPPFRYKVMNWGSGLKDEEEKKIIEWVKFSRNVLNGED